jgi:hypothetical protein
MLLRQFLQKKCPRDYLFSKAGACVQGAQLHNIVRLLIKTSTDGNMFCISSGS